MISAMALRAEDTATQAAPKTGSFEMNFTKRSPLSDVKTLPKKLQFEGKATDYDLSKITYLVYVPEKYDAAKPLGLLFLCNYKASEQLPAPVLPQLADANVAFIVAKELPEEWWQVYGLAFDAVQDFREQ